MFGDADFDKFGWCLIITNNFGQDNFYELWYLICDDDEEELYWIVSPIIWVKVIFDNWTFLKVWMIILVIF